MKATGELTKGLEGRELKTVESGNGVPTVIVCELDVDWAGEDESVAVSVTVKEPALVYVCVKEAPAPDWLSPKFQLIV